MKHYYFKFQENNDGIKICIDGQDIKNFIDKTFPLSIYFGKWKYHQKKEVIEKRREYKHLTNGKELNIRSIEQIEEFYSIENNHCDTYFWIFYNAHVLCFKPITGEIYDYNGPYNLTDKNKSLPKSMDAKLENVFEKKDFPGVFANIDSNQKYNRGTIAEFKPTKVFSWNNVRGKDDRRLKEFLKKRYSIDWRDDAKIEKTYDDTTIKLYFKNNFLSLKLNDEKNKVSLEIEDGRTDEFVARTEIDKLNIYEKFFCPEKEIAESKINGKKININKGTYFEYLSPIELETLVFLIFNHGDSFCSSFRGGTSKGSEFKISLSDNLYKLEKGDHLIQVKKKREEFQNEAIEEQKKQYPGRILIYLGKTDQKYGIFGLDWLTQIISSRERNDILTWLKNMTFNYPMFDFRW